MHFVDDIKSVTYLKSRAADVLKQINETHRPMIITQNGEAKAVIQDPQSYENMQNTLNLLKLIVQSEQDIENGDVISQKVMFDDLEKKLFD